MDRPALLNQTLAEHHPGAAALLSGLGRRLHYPQGIPSQSAEAKGCAINATIGQVTDGAGGALALPAVAAALGSLDTDEATLYASQGGNPELRRLWAEHIAADAPSEPAQLALPVVTAGLTHALSVVADLFADEGTPVLVPDPAWGNYRAIFGVRRGARMQSWRLMKRHADARGALDLDALQQALAGLDRPAVLVLNFPSNPAGYAPVAAEAQALVDVVAQAPHPLVVVCDDAYHGMWWEPEVYRHSLFHLLSTCAPGRVLAVKVDGATKELLYFGGRVGFLTFGLPGPGGEALEDKARAIARSTVSSVSSTTQAVLRRALVDPDLARQQGEIRARLAGRYGTLRRELQTHGLDPWPFNAGMFALVQVPGDAEELRLDLLREGVGVVSFPEAGALRLSYGSIRSGDIPALVAAIARHVR